MVDQSRPERRNDPRLDRHFILSYYDLNDPLIRHNASQLKNISLGGLCLITDRVFSAGTRIGIELRTPFLSDFIHLKGTVLNSKEKIKDIIYETRVKFDDLQQPTQTILKKLIEHFQNEKGSGHHE